MTAQAGEPAEERLPVDLGSEDFRDVIGHFASGVTVITTVLDGRRFGTTASAFSSLSLDPPMVLVALNKNSETGAAIAESEIFAVNILADDQVAAARRFAGKGDAKFDGVAISTTGAGLPLIAGALATLECRVGSVAYGGTHVVFLAEVDRARARLGTPLAYWRGRFGRLELSEAEVEFEIAAAEDALRGLGAILLAAAVAGRPTEAGLDAAESVLVELEEGGEAAIGVTHLLAAQRRFEAEIVSASGVAALVAAFHGIEVPAMPPSEHPGASAAELVRNDRELIAAARDADLDRLGQVVERRNELLAELVRADFEGAAE